MGSGETSPTMVTLHRELAAPLGPGADALILETPYGFQVNRADISARARDYFRRSVGLTTDVLPDHPDGGTRPDGSAGPGAGTEPRAGTRPHRHEGAVERARDRVHRADWVFSGPGSPSYALERWHERGLVEPLAERVRHARGVTVMASAAACTVGFAALPVYEVYKAGHAPRWLDGLDLLGALGLRVAVIPHYDNAEGGTHDTRFCYLGETRLAALERELPADGAVWGIDEHTALVIDLDARTARVWGRGVLTVRRRGTDRTVGAGTTLGLDQLRDLSEGRAALRGAALPAPRRDDTTNGTPAAADAGKADAGPVTLQEAVATAQLRFDTALAQRDGTGTLDAILSLEGVIAQWGADTEEDQGSAWARTVLRGLIRRLGEPVRDGLVEPGRTLGRLVPPLLQLRSELRESGQYATADRLRDILGLGAVALRDGAEGTRWDLVREPGARPDTGLSGRDTGLSGPDTA